MKLSKSPSGLSTVELVCSVMLLVPIALFAVNIGFLGMTSFVNDAACREAARVAAQQTSLQTAFGAAKSVVKCYPIACGLFGSQEVTNVAYNFFKDKDGIPIKITDIASTNLKQIPTVAVTTQVSVRLPAPMLLIDGGVRSSTVLRKRYTFPVLYGIDLDPNNTSGSTGRDEEEVDDTQDTTPPAELEIKD